MNATEKIIGIQEDFYRVRIEKIVEQFIREKESFKNLDKYNMTESLAELMKIKISPENFLNISDEELSEKIRKVMAVKALFHLLDDFTPEQKQIFNKAVGGR